MHNELLVTKLMRPPIPVGGMPRLRLFHRLDEGVSRRLTLVSTPPGFGKTTLLSSWSAEAKIPTAWLTLDEGDNDLARFLLYLTAAFQEAGGDAREEFPPFLHSPREYSELVITNLINTLAGKPAPLVLILDDYHVISEEKVHQALLYFIDHMPAGVHVVIASRADPPFPFARWRGHGEIAELRQNDLRLEPEEAAAFLSRTMEIELPKATVRTLTEHTEGWIAGIQMAALSMRQQEDPDAWIRTFEAGNKYILDYLMDEVWRRQPPEVQGFLLQTSVLNRFSAPLCDTLTGAGNGREMLERLIRANLFISPLDENRNWFRYPRLFADLLQVRLRQNRPGELPRLHRTAGEWFERNGLMEEAVEHRILAADFEQAAQLLVRSAEGTMIRGATATLQRRLESLPASVL